ncbi:Uncharacterised protein [Mycobacteroides abscessus subsp. massiliense]|nr:Uncharacterised protein [Mycobacteroides abscessus subsp. abscessus]SHZ39442.1 Uncharacterised protein [Mycobacteroides abscessus subsp. abscessus]SKN10683.1 Uncharacterised protein [Mycobacteroides abscessus subsp. massiliense]SKT21751.1 Uncharacterised protein [Mycobacteroides abscessus subsp. bolletii]SLF56772.1 Uncharacterised protein [Mycobacteroides abscessus subsp. bolletii]
MMTCVGVFVLGLIGLVCCPENRPLSTLFGVVTLGSAVAVPFLALIA